MLEASAVAIIAVSCSGVTALVSSLCHHMSQSRCAKLSCCGCIIERDVMDAEELEIINKQETNH